MKIIYLITLIGMILPSLALSFTVAFVGVPGPSHSSEFDNEGTEAEESDPITFRDSVISLGLGNFQLSAGIYPRLAACCFFFGTAFIVSLILLLSMSPREWIKP